MADEVNTTQSAAAPAAGTPQAAPEAAPTQEQQNGWRNSPRRNGPRPRRTPSGKNWRVCGRSCCSATLRTPPSSSWKRTVSPQGLPTCLPTRTRRPWKRAWPMCRVFSKAAWRPLSRNGCGARPRRAWAGPLLRKTPSGIRSRRISEEG